MDAEPVDQKGQLYLLEQLVELRETIIFTSLLYNKGYDKGQRWTARWGDTPGEVWKDPSTGASVSMELGYAISGCVHQSGSSLYPVLLGFLWRLHHIGEMDYYLNSHSSSLSGEWGCRAENSKLPVMAWSFWWLAPIQEPTKSPHLIRTKHTAITQEIPRDLGALSQEPESKIKCWNTRVL